MATSGMPKRGSISFAGTPKGRARGTIEAASDNPYSIDETYEWCNSFVSMPKTNGKVKHSKTLQGKA